MSKWTAGIPFIAVLAVVLYLFLPRYEIRAIRDTGVRVLVDRWRGDIVLDQTPIGSRDSRGRPVLDGGTQFARVSIARAVGEGVVQERQRAAQRRIRALGVVAAIAFASAALVLLFRRTIGD